MAKLLLALFIVVSALAAVSAGAEEPSLSAEQQARLDEVKKLDARRAELHKQGKYAEARVASHLSRAAFSY